MCEIGDVGERNEDCGAGERDEGCGGGEGGENDGTDGSIIGTDWEGALNELPNDEEPDEWLEGEGSD